ncbi:MAG: hypothetical protein AAGC59_18470, partial [Brucella pseudogrignonensis]
RVKAAPADGRAATNPFLQTILQNGLADERQQSQKWVSGSASHTQSNAGKGRRQDVCSLLFSFCQEFTLSALSSGKLLTYLINHAF